MSEDTPEMIVLPRAEFLKATIDACNNGAAAERQAIRDRLLVIRELTVPGSEASLELTKWVNQIG